MDIEDSPSTDVDMETQRVSYCALSCGEKHESIRTRADEFIVDCGDEHKSQSVRFPLLRSRISLHVENRQLFRAGG